MIRILSTIFLFYFLPNSFGIGKTEQIHIPIVYAIDNNCAMPTIVSMESAIKNINNSSFYEFIILVRGILKKDIKNLFIKFKHEYNNICSIKIKEIPTEYLCNILLSIPQILKEKDKIIYLSHNTLIRHDLKELFNTDINNEYIGGVIDPRYNKIEVIKKINKKAKEYVSSGVLLMNCKNLRELQPKIDFLYNKTKENNFYYSDQDLLNILCGGKIKILSFKFMRFNRLANIEKEYSKCEYAKKFYSEEEFLEGKKDPVIIHYMFCEPWVAKTYPQKLYNEWYEIYKTIKNKYNLKELNIQHLWEKTMEYYASSIIFDILLLITFWLVLEIHNPVLTPAFGEEFRKEFFNKRKYGIPLTD